MSTRSQAKTRLSPGSIYGADNIKVLGQEDRGLRPWILAALILACLILALSRGVLFLLHAELLTRSFRSMGGLATVTVGGADAERIEPITAKVHDIFERLERELSVYRSDSAIGLLAEKAGVIPIEVSDDAWRVLHLAHRFGELSDGAFDVTVAPQWGEDWQIGVRDPFDRSRIVGKVILRRGMALATLGNYERFVEIAGQRYSHIIDPRTGYPVTGTAGVTVLCGDATTADVLLTFQESWRAQCARNCM